MPYKAPGFADESYNSIKKAFILTLVQSKSGLKPYPVLLRIIFQNGMGKPHFFATIKTTRYEIKSFKTDGYCHLILRL